MSDFWTPAREEILKRLWAEGKTPREIRVELGAATRAVVIGKAWRLGLSIGAQPSPPPLARRPPDVVVIDPAPATVQAPSPAQPSLPALPADVPGGRALRIVDDGFSGCRWPLLRPHEAGDFSTRFCCAPAPGRTFCPVHVKRAYPPSTQQGGAKELIRGLRRYTS